MKRNDRILLKALDISNKKKEFSQRAEDVTPIIIQSHIRIKSPVRVKIKLSEDNDAERTDAIDSPVAPLYSHLTPLVTAASGTMIECQNAMDSPVAPLYSPLTPLVTAASGTMIERENAIDSPVAPLYSPLTPQVTAASGTMIECQNAMDSPVAPLYSHLTPLEAAESRTIQRKNSSPLPLMSPETFKLVETLDQTLTKDLMETVGIEDPGKDERHKINNYEDDVTDYSCDTDSDYVLDSDANSTNNRSKKRYIPESEDDSDDVSTVSVVQTRAMMHSVRNKKIQQPKTVIEISNSLNRSTSENYVPRENVSFNEKTIDNILESKDDSDDGISTVSIVQTCAMMHSARNEKSQKPKTRIEISNTLNCSTSKNYVARENVSFNDEIIDNEDDSNSSVSIVQTRTMVDSNHLEMQNERQQGRPRKGRKRKYPEHTIAQKKERKYKNLPYHQKNKQVESKVFKDYICKCTRKCFVLVNQEKRKEEFEKYILLGSYEAQVLYILNNVKESPKARTYTVTKNKSGKKKPREFRRNYCICDIEVCKEMFLNNFQICSKKVDVALKKNRTGNSLKDQRGQEIGGWNKTPEEHVEFIKKIINALPKYESHYRREKHSDRQYLKVGMTTQKIYNIYQDELKAEYGTSKEPVSEETLKRIFYGNFNLRCKTLKKDTCNRCDTFTHKIKNCALAEQRLKLQEEKEEHLKRAEDLRNKMDADLLQAKTDKKFECLTYDLEKTLPLPRIPTNIVFYKRQLWLYNSGIHIGSSDTGLCNVWVEGEAGRGAQEVGSCLVHFIKNNLSKTVEDLVLWSDCCGGQNRNIKICIMLKAVLDNHPNLKTITFKYLESGHTFLPNDTDFSKIEYQLRYHERIYTPEEYMNVMKSCKKKNPLKVYKMQRQDFISINKVEKNIVNRKTFVTKEKVNWLKTKEILLKKDSKYSIFMKGVDELFRELNIEKKSKGKSLPISEEDFLLLWPNGKEVAQAKLDDLTSMFDLIPKDCIEFYKSLKGNGNIVEDIDGFGYEPDFELLAEQDDEDHGRD